MTRPEHEIRRAIRILSARLGAMRHFGIDAPLNLADAWSKKHYGSHFEEVYSAWGNAKDALKWALGGESTDATIIEAQDDYRKIASAKNGGARGVKP